MPRRIKRACRHVLCPGTTIHRSGYCDAHQQAEGSWKKRQERTGNRHQRGYGTAWQKLRLLILKRDRYLCQYCKQLGIAEAGNTVDHIVSKAKGGTDAQSNLQTLCRRCHATKTGREGAEAALLRRS